MAERHCVSKRSRRQKGILAFIARDDLAGAIIRFAELAGADRRLGRSLKELLETVEDVKSRGIYLSSLDERIDTSSAAGELVFHVFGAIAHFEWRLISERTRKGLAAVRARGRPSKLTPEILECPFDST